MVAGHRIPKNWKSGMLEIGSGICAYNAGIANASLNGGRRRLRVDFQPTD